MFAGVAFAQVPHTYRQLVKNCPVDITPYDFWYTWDLYNMGSPNDYLTKTSTGCGTVYNASGQQIRWYAEAGNWPDHIWKGGDTCIVLGSWDPDEGAFEHAGEYWLFSDSLDPTLDTESWAPSDTMRAMEPAAVSSSARANISVEITNPYETDRSPWGTEEYDVLGFWVIADTTASGLTASYDVDLGFVAVNGGPGGITTFTYDSDVAFYPGFAKSLYHSYYIVARPETTVTPGVIPGFSTPHMAANSNLYTFGVEEAKDAEYVISSLAAAPNPFTQSARISYSLTKSSQVRLTIYNGAGQLIETLVNETQPAGKYSIDYDGGSLPGGVYFYRLETAKRNVTKTFVKVN